MAFPLILFPTSVYVANVRGFHWERATEQAITALLLCLVLVAGICEEGASVL